MKEKIIAGCILIGILMTLFPPQIIETHQNLTSSQGNSRLVDEEIEYRFIGGERNISIGFYEQTRIAFDRLFLQYLVLAGAGFVVYLLRPKKHED